jgi:hypothetical protein
MQSHFAWVTFVLFNCGIILESNIFVHIKVKQWARLAPRLGEDEVIKRMVVRDYQVLLDIHKVHAAHAKHLRKFLTEILPHSFQEFANGCALIVKGVAVFSVTICGPRRAPDLPWLL